MRPLILFSVGLLFTGCARQRVQVANVPSVSSVAGLQLRAQMRRCSEPSAVGDTLLATVIGGGLGITPPVDSGAVALFVIGEAAPGRLDGTVKPLFRLDPVALVTARGRQPFRGPSPWVEYRIYVPPDSGLLYICTAKGSLIVFHPS